MGRRAILVVVVVLVLTSLVAGGASYLGSRTQVGGPVYTVSQLEAGLKQNPGRWIGTTIKLQAAVLPFMQPCPPPAPRPCGIAYPLADIPPPSPEPGLVGRGNLVFFSNWLQLHPAADPLLNQVRRIPFLGRLVPAPSRSPGKGSTG